MFTPLLLCVIFVINPILSAKKIVDSDRILIQNKFVTCYTDRIVIHLYYFPYGDKTIKYKNIRSCELLQDDQLNFSEVKLWGMAWSPIWWHADFHRQSRKYFIILDANQWPKIGVTMNDNDTLKVYKLIKEKIGLTSLKKQSNVKNKKCHHRNST
jgi:hypothetical protein